MFSISFSPSSFSSDEEPVHEVANSHFEILHKEKVTGFNFLEQTKKDFHSIGLALGLVTRLPNLIMDLNK
ncbi:7748_t:CDS:2, partial [Acaulospora morrowiae]